MKYFAAYKCPMCSTHLMYGDPKEMKEEDLPELLAKVVKEQKLLGTGLYRAPMHIPHRCSNGSAGLAQFIGFRKAP